MTRFTAILATALVACGGDKTTDTSDSGGPVDTVPACDNGVASTFPLDGETDAYYMTEVRFTLEAEDATASITVMDSAGSTVNGSTVNSGKLATWSGDTLSPSSQYTATLTYACGEEVISFSTSDTGAPVGPANLVDRVYSLDLAGGQWVEPPDVGALLAGALGDTSVLVSPISVTDTEITMVGAIGAGGVQDLCTPTLPFPPAAFNDPSFSLQADALPLVISDFVVNIAGLDLSGAFSPTGDRIQGASLLGQVDTRGLGEALELGTDDGAICEFVAAFYVTCTNCSDGAPYCLDVYIDSVNAPEVPTTLVPRTEADIAGDAACTGA